MEKKNPVAENAIDSLYSTPQCEGMKQYHDTLQQTASQFPLQGCRCISPLLFLFHAPLTDVIRFNNDLWRWTMDGLCRNQTSSFAALAKETLAHALALIAASNK